MRFTAQERAVDAALQFTLNGEEPTAPRGFEQVRDAKYDAPQPRDDLQAALDRAIERALAPNADMGVIVWRGRRRVLVIGLASSCPRGLALSR